MATGGVNVPPPTAEEDSMTCAICLGIYSSPKLLPCSHTFCVPCLADLTSRHPTGKFPCPACREVITLPPGGVAVFKTNHYLKPEDLERARDGTVCVKHPKQDLDLYCVECDLPICLKCKMTKHEGHKTQDLSEAIPGAKSQLCRDKSRLERCVLDVHKHVELATQEQQAVKDKHAALVTLIRDRQATLQAAVDKYTDDALASLDKVTADISHTLQTDLDCLQQNLQELTKLQQLVQQAMDSDAGSGLVTVAREMRCGRGSGEAVQTKQMTTACRPVLRFSATLDATLARMRNYMGSVAKMEMAVSAPEVTVVEQFRCREDPDTEVYHVCPMTNDCVWVSYEPYMLRYDAVDEKFSTDGNCVQKRKHDIPGRVTRVRRKNGNSMCPAPEAGKIITYAKKCKSDLIRFSVLDSGQAGQATVGAERILSEDTLETEATSVFTLHCAAHRAFDADASEQLFVVLEEGKTPDWQRRVQLYRRPQPDAIATYSPPVAPFQPSDVCFYTLGGHEVLLVADELNDAICCERAGRAPELRALPVPGLSAAGAAHGAQHGHERPPVGRLQGRQDPHLYTQRLNRTWIEERVCTFLFVGF